MLGWPLRRLLKYSIPYAKKAAQPYLASIVTHVIALVASFHINLFVSYGLSTQPLVTATLSPFALAVVVNVALSATYDRLYEFVGRNVDVDAAAAWLFDNANERTLRRIKWAATVGGLTYIGVALAVLELDNRVLARYTLQYIASTAVYECVVKFDGDYSLGPLAYRWLRVKLRENGLDVGVPAAHIDAATQMTKNASFCVIANYVGNETPSTSTVEEVDDDDVDVVEEEDEEEEVEEEDAYEIVETDERDGKTASADVVDALSSAPAATTATTATTTTTVDAQLPTPELLPAEWRDEIQSMMGGVEKTTPLVSPDTRQPHFLCEGFMITEDYADDGDGDVD